MKTNSTLLAGTYMYDEIGRGELMPKLNAKLM